MNEALKRSIFLMSYQTGKDLKVINESVDLLLESKQTEAQAFAFFKKIGIDEDKSRYAIEQFRKSDQTKNKSLTMPMAIAFSENKDLNEISKTFQIVSKLVNENKIQLPSVDNSGNFLLGPKMFGSYSSFAQYINEFTQLSTGYGKWKSEIKVDTKSTPIYPRNAEEEKTGIVIYDGNDVGRCIHYGMGGITGQYYQFCISKPGNTNWKGYRDQKGSTFYFVFDKKRPLEDPLHMTVVDRTVEKGMYEVNNGFEVTDVNNTTNSISQFGTDILKYIESLRNRGVPVDEIFVNKSKTPEEEEEHKKFGSSNYDVDWFRSLSFDDQTKYIGRGHRLSDAQFEYLWRHRKNPGAFHLLKQHLNMGIPLSEWQFELLTTDEEKNEI